MNRLTTVTALTILAMTFLTATKDGLAQCCGAYISQGAYIDADVLTVGQSTLLHTTRTQNDDCFWDEITEESNYPSSIDPTGIVSISGDGPYTILALKPGTVTITFSCDRVVPGT